MEERPGRAGPATGETRRPRTPHHLLAYTLSLPERSVRWLVGLAGGGGGVLAKAIPGPLRNTRFYKTAVERQLRMMTDVVGRAEIYVDATEALDARTTMRIGVGGTLDNLMILGLHVSPIWALLAATDVCEGARRFTNELGQELKDAGFMKEGSRFDSVDDVLEGLGRLSSRLADTFDKPPLSLDDMKQAVSGIRTELSDVTGTAVHETARLDELARGISAVARAGRRPVLEVASAVAMGTLTRTGNLLGGTAWGAMSAVRIVGEHLWADVVMDYVGTLRRMREVGYYRTLASVLSPHSRSLRRLFAYRFVSWTELVLSLGRWRKAAWSDAPQTVAPVAPPVAGAPP